MTETPAPLPEPSSFAVCRDGEPVPASLAGSVLAIGNFDGLHRGHRHLIETARREATARGRPAAALTFDPHPRAFFGGGSFFDLLPLDAKLKVFSRTGLDGAFVRRFDADLAATSPDAFVRAVVVETFGASGLVVGGDFHFGRGRAGTPDMLAALARQNGLACTLVDLVAAEGVAVSSSRVREALAAGRVADANALLGYRWFVTGTVIHGEKRGRLLAFPTANLRLGTGCRLRHGIYAVRAAIAPGLLRDGVASFGSRPTFDDGAPLLETHLFDFAGDLYGRTIEVEFVGWIRPEERFASADDLVREMERDAATARALLARPAGDGESVIG